MSELVYRSNRFHLDRGGPPNLRCECGSQWFIAVVIVGAEDEQILWSKRFKCAECDREIELGK